MTPARAKRKFPQLANNHIKYCSIFYEGMHDDARTNLAIAQTAAREGASIANYCEVVDLSRDAQGRVVGATVLDSIAGSTFEIRAKSVLFCGGPFTDELRKMEQPSEVVSSDSKVWERAVTGASGIHIVLPEYYAPSSIGLVDMNTSDGRFLFFLPWQGHVVVGTTDQKCAPTMRPVPDESVLKKIIFFGFLYTEIF
jgi:glycerol-3-phosphate dehydrogenase